MVGEMFEMATMRVHAATLQVANTSENTTYTARNGMDSLLGISSATISCTKRKPSSTVTAKLILSYVNKRNI